MSALGDYWRLMRAGTALARHDVVLPGSYHSRLPIPARMAGSVLRLFGGAKGRPGQRLATALEGLGPAYIKLGQFLATRPDVFGSEVADDLSRLKDKLPPFSMKQARAALAAEFGEAEAARLFPGLSDPVAAASLALGLDPWLSTSLTISSRTPGSHSRPSTRLLAHALRNIGWEVQPCFPCTARMCSKSLLAPSYV